MSVPPRKFTPTRSGSVNTNISESGRSSVLSIASSGSSAGSSSVPRNLGSTPSKPTSSHVRSNSHDLSKSRAVASKQTAPTLRPPPSIAAPKTRALSPIPSSPKKARSATYDSPARSPSKAALQLHVDTEGDGDVTDQLVDATIVNDFDLSTEFDMTEISKMLNDERNKENASPSTSTDKVLVSVRVKPPGNDEDAWTVEPGDCKLSVKDQYARTAASSGNEYRYDNVITGSNNRTVYDLAAKRHVFSAMEGFNAVIFAYGQTASGKTFTLSGSDEEPGIIPRAMRDVFGYIKATPDREYLLRASYIEIYNEQIHDLLASGVGATRVPVTLQGTGFNVTMTPLREEVVTSLKAVKEVMERGESNRRTASTDWNERSSRSHSVFRLVIESRERVLEGAATTGVPSTPSGSRLHVDGAQGVRMSTLSLIDLAGSEKATSDKERTKEAKYINTSLLTLGTVIGTLAENASKGKSDHVPFRNSKLTRMLQPSLSGDARISVICTINTAPSAVSESLSTLGFASRVKKVALNASKKEIVDHEALIERYRKEIDELKAKLQEKEVAEKKINRRLSTREKADERRDKTDMNIRLKQLSKLILTSNTVDVTNDLGPASPIKIDFDLSPYQLQEELLGAKRRLESQETQILSLEAALAARPLLPQDAPEDDKDRVIADLQRTNRELTFAVQGYEENLGEPLRAVKEDVEKEWIGKVESLEKELEGSREWVKEVLKELEKEKALRVKLEEEKRALVSFVTDIDVHMRERTSFTSSLPRLSFATPRSSMGAGGDAGGNRRRSLGSVLIEASNGPRAGGGQLGELKELKEESEDKENAQVVTA